MNKNPFLPQQPSFPPQQPPLPPGPPPPQPPYYQYNWSPEQSALYANYGYGPQGNWQRQQHQFHPQPPPPPPPQPPPAYNPYQPAPVYPHYKPQYPPPPTQHVPIFVHPPIQPIQHQPARPIHQPPTQHLPPAKRPRFDSPQNGLRNAPTQPQFQPSNSSIIRGAPAGNTNRGRSNIPIRGGRGGGGPGAAVKAPIPGRQGSRGGSFTGPGGLSRGGIPLRGHGSRGNFGGNRRGGGSFSGSFQGMRGRGQGHLNAGRGRHDPSSKDGATTSGYGSVGKREENRRTFTDFKIIGLEIPDLNWSWGTVPQKKSGESGEKENSEPAPDDDESATAAAVPEPTLPPSRLRIYFHTPVTPDDSQPISTSISLNTIPSDSRKGKRKKLEDDDGEDGARERPPPPQMNDDGRSSVAPSVVESVGDDWLMAAIAESEKTESEPAGDEEEHALPEVADNASVTATEDDPHHSEYSSDLANYSSRGGRHSLSQPLISNLQGKETSERHDSEPPESNIIDSSSAHPDDVATSSALNGASLPPKPHEPADSEEEVKAESSNLPELLSVSAPPPPHNESSSSLVVVEPSADHIGSEPQVPDEETRPSSPVEPALPLTSQATLLDLDTESASYLNDHESSELIPTQTDEDHLPEPPNSTSSASVCGDSKTEPKIPSANRLSVAYAAGERRLVIDAQVVESLRVFRSLGRIEIKMSVTGDTDDLKGIVVESLSSTTKAYTKLQADSGNTDDDPTVPPFSNLPLPSNVALLVYLDTDKPLSEPRWVKTGDTAEWLRSIFGRMFWAAGEAAEGWEKRVSVEDPDPPPTIRTVLDAWAACSPIGAPAERQRFLKVHMNETENILEILLRLVRGERATAFPSSQPSSLSNVTGPLLSAISPTSAHGSQQTHVSLAVLALFRMTVEYATKADGDKGKIEVEERVGEIIRCIPSHLIHKSLDGIFKEWKAETKGR